MKNVHRFSTFTALVLSPDPPVGFGVVSVA